MTPKLNSTETAATMQPLFDYVTSLAPNDTGVEILSLEVPSFGVFFESFLAGSGAARPPSSHVLPPDPDDALSPSARTP